MPRGHDVCHEMQLTQRLLVTCLGLGGFVFVSMMVECGGPGFGFGVTAV